MPPYPRNKDLSKVQNNLLSKQTGAREEIVSYTPFMLYVCERMESGGRASQGSESGVKGSSLYKGWAEMDENGTEKFAYAAKTERVRRRLQCIYSKSWDESAKEITAISAATPAEVISKLREIDRKREKSKHTSSFGRGAGKSSKKSVDPAVQETKKDVQKPLNKIVKKRRATSAYQIFSEDAKANIRVSNSKCTASEIDKLLREQWNDMGPEERKPYVLRSKLVKKRKATVVAAAAAPAPKVAKKPAPVKVVKVKAKVKVKEAPKKVMPKKEVPKKVVSKKVVPKKVIPKKAVPKKVVPRKVLPKKKVEEKKLKPKPKPKLKPKPKKPKTASPTSSSSGRRTYSLNSSLGKSMNLGQNQNALAFAASGDKGAIDDVRIKCASESGESIILASTTPVPADGFSKDGRDINDEFSAYLSVATFGTVTDVVV